MNTTAFPTRSRARARWLGAALVLVLAPLAIAAERAPSRSRGFVDGSAFSTLAGEGSEVVEINLQAPLLRALAHDDAEPQGLADFARKLESVSAYVVQLEHDAARLEKALSLVREMETKLEREGWQRLATVREKSERVSVYLHSDERGVDGLVVLVVDTGESEVVFANIAGTIDLASLGKLGETLSVPGLGALGAVAGESDPEKKAPPVEK